MAKLPAIVAVVLILFLLSSCTPMIRIPRTEPSVYVYPAPAATPAAHNIKAGKK